MNLSATEKDTIDEFLFMRKENNLINVDDTRQYQLIKLLKKHFSFEKLNLIDSKEIRFALNADEKTVYFLDLQGNKESLNYYPEDFKIFFVLNRDLIEIYNKWFGHKISTKEKINSKRVVDEEKLKSIEIQLDNLLDIEDEHIIYESERRKKLNFIKDKLKEINERICEDSEMPQKERRKLQHLSLKASKFLLDINCSGRSSNALLYISYYYLVKKELAFFISNTIDFEVIKPLIYLHEILLEIVNAIPSSTRHYFKKSVLNNSKFCNKALKNQILLTPDDILRSQFFLNRFNLDKELNNVILNYTELAISKLPGKDIKGILGAIVYILSKKKALRLTQSQIASALNITEVTLRSRARDIKELIF